MPTPLVEKKNPFFHWIIFVSLSKISWLCLCGSISGLSILFHWAISFLFPIPPYGYCRFIISVKFSSVAQSCLTLCDPMDRSVPGFPVHHQLSEFAQTHVHWVGDAIQPPHLLSSPSPPAFNLSQSSPMSINPLRIIFSPSVLCSLILGLFTFHISKKKKNLLRFYFELLWIYTSNWEELKS